MVKLEEFSRVIVYALLDLHDNIWLSQKPNPSSKQKKTEERWAVYVAAAESVYQEMQKLVCILKPKTDFTSRLEFR